jgi:hypothetical protein
MNLPTPAISSSLSIAEPLRFVKKREISRLTGLSGETLKKYRLSGVLSKDIHWIRINPKVVLYNVPLIMDWLRNINNPDAHQELVEAYRLSLLPSSKPRRGGSQKPEACDFPTLQ